MQKLCHDDNFIYICLYIKNTNICITFVTRKNIYILRRYQWFKSYRVSIKFYWHLNRLWIKCVPVMHIYGTILYIHKQHHFRLLLDHCWWYCVLWLATAIYNRVRIGGSSVVGTIKSVFISRDVKTFTK